MRKAQIQVTLRKTVPVACLRFDARASLTAPDGLVAATQALLQDGNVV